ncbi:MAG: hypothetical protein HOH59_09645 [Rhodospirillaceae bacterium]|nr:hypothetical protein [Rhodospirillaceae bacterium]
MSSSIVDLVVLSVVARRSLKEKEIIKAAKDVARDYWNPTSDVICESLERLIIKNCLRIVQTKNGRTKLLVTSIGMEQLSALLLMFSCAEIEIGQGRLLEFIQLSSLDLVPDKVAVIIIQRMLNRANSLLDELKKQERFSHTGQKFIDVWLKADREDLTNRANILSEIAKTNLLANKVCHMEVGRYQ